MRIAVRSQLPASSYREWKNRQARADGIRVKMDSVSERDQHESCAKRLKLDLSGSKSGVLCDEGVFGEFSGFKDVHIEPPQGVSSDCNFGYDASTLESVPTSLHITSPNANSHESLSELADAKPDLDDDDNASTVSNLSELSGLSKLSGQDWKPCSGSLLWVKRQMSNGTDPRSLLETFGTDVTKIPEYVDDVTLWRVIINIITDLAEHPKRHKLRHVNTLDDVVRLVKGAKNIIILTGAGVSVSCGIPDFRSRDGIYSRLAVDFPDLPDPQAMFDIHYFKHDPRPFFKFAKDIYPGQFQPSPCHRFIKLLERHNKLLRNYTQNIDTLENVAGIEKVIECHGSFATATCTRCSYKCNSDSIKDAVLEQRIPMCPRCLEGRGSGQTEEINYSEMVSHGIMKPDIVFFGEGLSDNFHEAMADDKDSCDLLIVIGSSLKVRPVALIPSSLPAEVPQILINREPLPLYNFDVELLGDCDVIINQLCHMLGNPWTEGSWCPETLQEAEDLLPPETDSASEADDNDNAAGETDTSRFSSEQTEESCDVISQSDESSNSKTDSENHLLSNSECSTQFTSADLKTSVKERHISIDSARDSGIGDSSNLPDNITSKNDEDSYDHSHVGMGNYWQPKVKLSLVDRLPDNSYYLVPPNRYIFPGAEVYYDPDESFY